MFIIFEFDKGENLMNNLLASKQASKQALKIVHL